MCITDFTTILHTYLASFIWYWYYIWTWIIYEIKKTYFKKSSLSREVSSISILRSWLVYELWNPPMDPSLKLRIRRYIKKSTFSHYIHSISLCYISLYLFHLGDIVLWISSYVVFLLMWRFIIELCNCCVLMLSCCRLLVRFYLNSWVFVHY